MSDESSAKNPRIDQRETTSSPAIKLSYFAIEGVAEKVRLTLTVMGVPFTDDRIARKDWGALKACTPNGQLPVMTIGDQTISQSDAMLRWAARKGDGSLYPVNDVDKCLDIDILLGLAGDDIKAYTPGLYLGMRPTTYGYAEGFDKTDEGKAMIKTLRTKYVQEVLPTYMKHLTAAIASSGGPFLCGGSLTLADMVWLPRIRLLQSGIADHVPATSVDAFPEVLAWKARVMAVPSIAEWYAK